MSETLNSLLGGIHSAGSLPAPVVLNPLKATADALSTAGSVYDLRSKQADEAWGNALQQATDPTTGQVDFPKAQRLAAGMGPVAQMGMAKNLRNTSEIQSQQIEQGNALASNIARGAMTIMYKPDDGNVNQVFDRLKALYPGQAAQIDAERQVFLNMKDPAQRAAYAYQHGTSILDARDNMARSPAGSTSGVDIGGAMVPVTIRSASPYGPGSLSVGQGSANYTMSPNTIGSQIIEWDATADDVKAGRASAPGVKVRMGGPELQTYLGNGGIVPPGARTFTIQPGGPSGAGGGGAGGGSVRNSDGSVASPNNPPRIRQLNVPGGNQGGAAAPPGGAATPPGVPPAPPGAGNVPPPAGGYGGLGAALKALPPPAAATPAPRSDLLLGGTQIAASSPYAPAVGQGSPPSPAVQGDVGAILTGMQQGRTPAPGTQTAGATFATGPGYDERANAAASAQRLTDDNNFAANYVQNAFPQVQALNLYGRGMTTAPGSDFANDMKGWAGGVLRSMGFTGAFDSTKEYDELHKWLSQIVTSNPYAGGSDARLAATLSGNANTGIHELAGADMLKTGIALMRMRATANAMWNGMSSEEKAKYGGYYNDFLRQFNKDVDVRGFAIDMMNTEQKKTLLADIKAHGGAGSAYERKIMQSRQWGSDAGYMGSERTMP